jgi:CheY-like chemotaxis protein
MTTLLLAFLVAIAASVGAWRFALARRRAADTQAARAEAERAARAAARKSAASTATASAAVTNGAEVDAARASARAKAERVIAAEAARRKAAIQKAQNVARVEAERRAAEAAKAAAALASTLPSTRLPRVERTAPLPPPVPAPVARPPAAPQVLKTTEQTLVMLVDDSKMVRVKSSRLLATHGFQVVTAVDGIDALKQLEHCCPDLVITDVDMPGMDGFGLVNALRGNARTRHIPLVMITSAEDRHREEALRVGVGLVMGKPYDEPALIAHIRSFKFFARAVEAESLACA